MKTTSAIHVKLGVFAVVALVAVIAIGFVLGMRAWREDVIAFHTYFDESVQGLDLGAPVKYRGVPIGHVVAIAVAPDRKHVDVTLGIEATAVARLGLPDAPNVRARLGTQGITGVKYLDLDFASVPPPVLPFPPAARYIPSRPSLLKGIEDRVGDVGTLLDRAVAALDGLDRVFADIHDTRLPQRAATTLDDLDAAIRDARRVIDQLARARVPQRAGGTLDRIDRAVARLDELLGGEAGLVASAKRSVDALGRGTTGSTRELEHTLRDISDAAHAIRDFVDTLERDPDMLVKGRARTNKR